MRRLIAVFFLLIAVPACAPVEAAANPLRQAVAEGAKSMAWKISTEGVSICCCDDGNTWTNHGDRTRIEYTHVIVVAEMDGRRVAKLRMKEPTCPVKVERLLTATNDESLDFLLEHLPDADREGELLSVIAMHDHPRVVPELIHLARNGAHQDVRKHALFWLGQKAGEKAAGELRRAVDEDPNDEVKQHAVFAISQLPKERSVPILVNLVKTHKSAKVRKRAMFWLAQTGDQRALDLIEEILGAR
ncbi:MAG: HEAT repeat domain-containing protein [Thermoanaerobaculia bacterium]